MNLILVHKVWLVGAQNFFIDPDISLGLPEEEHSLLEIAELWNATHDANAFPVFGCILKLEFDTVLFANLVWDYSGVLQVGIVSVISGHVCLQWYFIVLVGEFLDAEDVVGLGVLGFGRVVLFVNLDVLPGHCIFHLHPLGVHFSGWGSGLHAQLVRRPSPVSDRRRSRLLLRRRAPKHVVNVSRLLVIEVPSIVVELALVLAHCIFLKKLIIIKNRGSSHIHRISIFI